MTLFLENMEKQPNYNENVTEVEWCYLIPIIVGRN